MSLPIRTAAFGAALALAVPVAGLTCLGGLPAADAHPAAALVSPHVAGVAARSPLGDDPKNRNGRGPLKVKLTNTADGRIKVHWKGKGPRKNFKPWKIKTSTSRDMNSDVKVYHAKGKKRSIVVKPAPGVTPTSGDYTFVKVIGKRKHGLKGGSSPTHWIQPTPPTPVGTGRVTIGTFNVRDADIAADAGTAHSWANRKAKVISTIRGSGAGIVNLQEASGMNGTNRLTQADDIASGTGYALVNSDFYRSGGAITGKQGTRILYNPALYHVVSSGARLIQGAAWIAWAEFQDTSGKRFWDVTMHLQTGNSAADESLRVTQAQQVIAVTRQLATADGSREVIVAGDSNSTFYSKPKAKVHPTFMQAGFNDAFATASISGQAYPTTNDFKFPVKPGPTRRDVILDYNGPAGAYWYHNLYYTSAGNLASDHFMQVAQLPLA